MAKDQYKYFRIEAHELLEGLNHAVLELERGGSGEELVAKILRFAHTLKGASRVVKQTGIAEMAHAVESAVAPYRYGANTPPRECTNQVLGLLDAMAAQVAALDSPSAEQRGQTPGAAPEEIFETVRVEIEEMDTLLEGVSEAGVQLATLRRDMETALERARHLAESLLGKIVLETKVETNESGQGPGAKLRATADELGSQLERLGRSFAGAIDQVDAEFAQVRDAANRLRLLPASAVFGSLERAVRDAAQSLGREVAFETLGGDQRLDAHVLAALRGALLHVVRNAVAHGIESRAERLAARKSLPGRVELRVERRGKRVAFVCRDDGRGVDVEAVRRVAVQRGLIGTSSKSSLGPQEVVEILMKGGVTTTGAVNEVSGRGIGLDVVRETATRLKGEVALRSEPGQGTSLEICVPVSLSSVAALEVEVSRTVAAIPMDAVRQTLRLADSDIARTGEKDSIVHHGRAIPFLGLRSMLHRKKGAGTKRRFWSSVVVEGSLGMAAIGVDRLLGTASVVMRALPSLSVADIVVLGVSLNAEGNPQLVLDPEGLIAIGASTGGPAAIVEILKGLPGEFPVPILLIIHIGEPFSASFADWLDGLSTLGVRYACDGELLPALGQAGIVMAPPGQHLVVQRGKLRVNRDPERNSCRPSVDVLFESLAKEVGGQTVACLLTGMGRDGAAGLLALRHAGALTIAQDEKSSVVFGMPREAIQIGAAERVLGLDEIAPALSAIARETELRGKA